MLLVHEIHKPLAVIITCHKYEHFLSEAIDSVLSQDITPAEIIIVDDCPDVGDCLTPYHSTKCEKVLEKYKYSTISRIETTCGDPLKARQAGFEASNSEYVCFLDADDKLGKGYIEEALKHLHTSDVVYSDIQYFENKTTKTDFPETMNPAQIAIGNFMHVGCMTKRSVIEASHAFNHPPLTNYHEDWFFWRKVLKAGFKIKKQKNLYHARYHDDNRSNVLHSEQFHTNAGHFQTRGTAGDTITFVGFGGTNEPLVLRQEWPTSQIHFNVYNNTPCWLIDLKCGFTYSPHLSNRLDIINHTLKTVTTDWVFFYDEDGKYPSDICESLLKRIGPKVAIHDTNFEFLGCTMIVAPIVKNTNLISENQLERFVRNQTKYV